MYLEKGDTIGILALSGVCDSEKVERAKSYLENEGYKVVLSKNIFDKNRYLAGSDEDKIEELHNFFKNPEIKLVLNARGGYGAIRLIDKIDYNVIRENPKPFCGYSDITALLLMFYKKAGIVSYHSPMASGDFGEENINQFTVKNFWQAINGEKLTFEGTHCYKKGSAEGILLGGNLATVVSLCGLDFVPDEDFIFFAEDLNEPVYKIDKMFQQLLNMDKFRKNCKAVILGDFLSVDNTEWLDEYLYELSEKLDIPIVKGFKITHEKEKITLPVGKIASLNDTVLKII